jgi:aminoglycoside 6'-N-acetyltransferase I
VRVICFHILLLCPKQIIFCRQRFTRSFAENSIFEFKIVKGLVFALDFFYSRVKIRLMSEQQFNVRLLREADFPEWFRLRKMLWDEASEEEHRTEMLDIIRHPDAQLILIAENNAGKLIGFLEASIRPFVEDCHSDHVGYLEGWFVESHFRKFGIGKRLVREAEDWARVHGCEEMASDSEIGNDVSLKAHLSLGYDETSRLVHLRKDL